MTVVVIGTIKRGRLPLGLNLHAIGHNCHAFAKSSNLFRLVFRTPKPSRSIVEMVLSREADAIVSCQ